MIFKIKTPKQAEDILRSMAATKAEGTVIFDIVEGVNPLDVPMIIRECYQPDHEFEYIGWNIWKILRMTLLIDRGPKCEVCSRGGTIHAHHLTKSDIRFHR